MSNLRKPYKTYTREFKLEALRLMEETGRRPSEIAMEKINAGASLVQLYTGYVYNGPELISDCALAISNH